MLDHFSEGLKIGLSNRMVQHTAISVKEWFQRQHITLLPWPAPSPDMNPIEKIFGHIWTRNNQEECGKFSIVT